MKLKRKKHKSSISICNEMCKNYLSVTSNAVRSRSGGGARGGGDNFAIRSGGGGVVLLLFMICASDLASAGKW